jgi:putative heme-binding domain-containing protein
LPEGGAVFTARTFAEALRDKDPAILDKAIAAVRDVQFPEKMKSLVPIISDAQGHGPRRAAALEALMNVPMASLTAAKALADPSSMTLRKKAAELLGVAAANNASPTSLADRNALVSALPISPAELATLIASGLARTDEGTDKLLQTIESGKATPALLRHVSVATALEQRPQGLRDRAAALTKDLPPEDARIDKIIAKRVEEFRVAKADVAHGKQIYTQTCGVCHKLRNEGGNIGPALDGVAARGLHRLCEDILDPNRNVDPIFRQTVVETTDGQTLAGLNARVEGELLTVTDATGKNVSVPKASVKSQTLSRLSLMLPTFEQTLPPADFNDLLGFLLDTPK